MKDYSLIKQTILNSILKDTPSAALSQKMGFNFNKVKKWQDGSKLLRWDEFCELCKTLNINLGTHLYSVLGLYSNDDKDIYGIVPYLRTKHADETSLVLAKKLGISLSVFNRYIAELIYPDLEFILRLMDLRRNILDLFVNSISSITDKVPAKLAQYPWIPAVQLTFLMKEYKDLPKHSDDWIANFLKISVGQVKQAIENLLACEVIEKPLNHYIDSKTKSNQVNYISDGDHARDMYKFIHYWTEEANRKFSQDPTPPSDDILRSRCAYRIFPTTTESIKKINEVMVRAEQEIVSILAEQDESALVDVRTLLIHNSSCHKK